MDPTTERVKVRIIKVSTLGLQALELFSFQFGPFNKLILVTVATRVACRSTRLVILHRAYVVGDKLDRFSPLGLGTVS